MSSCIRKLVVGVTYNNSEIKLNLEDGSVVLIKGSWIHNTIIKENDIVNIFEDKFNPNNDYLLIDDNSGLLVVNPDILISITSVVSSLFCLRKAFFNEKFKNTEGLSKTLFLGNILHIIFQESLKSEINSEEQINQILNIIFQNTKTAMDMKTLNLNFSEIKIEISSYVPHILYFIQTYINGQKKLSAPSPVTSKASKKPSIWPGKISQVLDIEENIWSPKFGLKGKIDLTTSVNVSNNDLVVPLELKTGSSISLKEHKAQVILYTMMLSKYYKKPKPGLLFYLQNSSLEEINANLNELRSLTQLRNQLVALLTDSNTELNQEPINNKKACENCHHLIVCSLNLNLEKLDQTHPMKDIGLNALNHLRAMEIDYFHKWTDIFSKEHLHSVKSSTSMKHLWTCSPDTWQSMGVGVSNLILRKLLQLRHTFEGVILPCPLNVGDSVVVSTSESIAISFGQIEYIGSSGIIEIILDKNLFVDRWKNDKFHLSKTNNFSSSSTSLCNLSKLMSNTAKAKKLRSLIILNKFSARSVGFPKLKLDKTKSILKHLNTCQKKAIFSVLMTKDVALVQGMPGTGKTTFIAALIRIISNIMNKSILVCCFTNSALDNLLIKLDSFGDVNFLRLGRKSRIHTNLYHRTVNNRQSIRSSSVVGVTFAGINHPYVTNHNFDYLIIDEACQSFFLSSLGPFFHAKTYVLVGDPLQLPPIPPFSGEKYAESVKSIYDVFSKNHQPIILNIQYRMNSKITEIANKFMYEGSLKCGSKLVAGNTCDDYFFNDRNWIKTAMSSKLDLSVVFIDTINSAHETEGPINEGEIKLIKILYKKIMNYEVGIIAPYVSQVSALKRCIQNIDISTIDQFQGKDKDVIIISCTKSTMEKEKFIPKKSSILNDKRRLNVALTRAKKKIILIGNKSTLIQYEPFEYLFNKCLSFESIIKVDLKKMN